MDFNDINTGRKLFESIPNDFRPGWALHVLTQFDAYIQTISLEVKTLYTVIDDAKYWKQAHEQFDKIRRFRLGNPSFQPYNYLHLAELVAKVTYNASGELAPFDTDSGWHIPKVAVDVAVYFGDELEEKIKLALLSYNNLNR